MNKLKTFIAAMLTGVVLTTGAAMANEGAKNAADIDFSFEGPFGKYDRGQLQRGFLVFHEVCSACHEARLLYYRNLGEPGGPEFTKDEVKAIAAGDEVAAEPNEDGDVEDRPAKPSDRYRPTFPNEQAARASNGGALPPDLSLITKAREGWSYPWYVSPFIKLFKGSGGAEYVHAVLTGFDETPDEHAGEAPEGKHYNPYFQHGPWISMAPPLSDEGVEYGDGTKATVDQQAQDVAAFLNWVSEPKMYERKRLGFMVMIYLAILTTLLYLVKRAVWSKMEH